MTGIKSHDYTWSKSRVAHTFRSLECMRQVSDVESRHAPAEALLRREPPSFFNEERVPPGAAV
jgi:hypothetical protein